MVKNGIERAWGRAGQDDKALGEQVAGYKTPYNQMVTLIEKLYQTCGEMITEQIILVDLGKSYSAIEIVS